MNDAGVCRTARATPGLVNVMIILVMPSSNYPTQAGTVSHKFTLLGPFFRKLYVRPLMDFALPIKYTGKADKA